MAVAHSVRLDLSEVEVRERRLGLTVSYQGTAGDLNSRARAGTVPVFERSFEQCSTCQEGCAGICTFIRGAAVVEHSPIGCTQPAGAAMSVNVGNAARGLPKQSVNVMSTNLSEAETVLGGGEKLRATVREAYRRFSPAAIFVLSSCAAGIIGDDIEAITDDLEEELGVPVIPVFCEGFKSKVWASGFDATFHGLLRKIVKPARKKQTDLVNIFNFEGSDTFSPLLGKLGLRANYVISLTDIPSLSRMSEAACTAHICETLATYPAKALEQEYGVPEVKSPPPFGIGWTDAWLREVASLTGREKRVEQVIRTEHERIAPELEDVRRRLAGRRVYVYGGDSYAHSMSNMLLDLGLDVVGVTTLHHDFTTDGGYESTESLNQLVASKGDIDNFSVCNKQPFQVFKVLKQLKPDMLITRHSNMSVTGAKAGIPTVQDGDVNVSAGYDGLVKLGERLITAWRTRRLFQKVGEHYQPPYSDWWMAQDDPFLLSREQAVA